MAITTITLRKGGSGVFHQTGQALLRSVEKRCPICVRLYTECVKEGYNFSDPQVRDDFTVEYTSRPVYSGLFSPLAVLFYGAESNIVSMELLFDPPGMNQSHPELPGGWAELLQHDAGAPNSLSSSDTGS
jgi:hypothetical protein